MAALEDAGFYCVDNMPVDLLPKFLDLLTVRDSELAGVALVMDLRGKGFIAKYKSVFDKLKRKGYRLEILFLEAEEETLLQRYSTTRRQHPLAGEKSLSEGIRKEKVQLADLRAAADELIDTSKFSVHNLKSKILEIAKRSKKLVPMHIVVLSFGYKYGIPYDADLIMDVRFLINPYFIPELKDLDGEAAEIKDYVLKEETTRTFLDKYIDFLDYLIPLYEKEGKAYLTIAIGCTGGRHRSVTIAGKVFEHLSATQESVILNHRDLTQPS